MASLQQHLSKLDAVGPVQDYAIAAIFETITIPLSAPHETALRRCLCLPTQHAVGIAADKLTSMVHDSKLEHAKAQSLLLSALSVSDESKTYTPLIYALVDVFSSSSALISSPTTPWKSHILSKALLSCPASGQDLITATCRLLSTSASNTTTQFSSTFNSLKPFFNFVIMDSTSTTTNPLLSSFLCDTLARIGCSLWNRPDYHQYELFSFFSSFLSALPVNTHATQIAAISIVANTVDLVVDIYNGVILDADDNNHNDTLLAAFDFATHLQNTANAITRLAHDILHSPASYSINHAASTRAPAHNTHVPSLSQSSSSIESLISALYIISHMNVPSAPFPPSILVDVVLLSSVCDGVDAIAGLSLISSHCVPSSPPSLKLTDAQKTLIKVVLVPKLAYSQNKKYTRWLLHALQCIEGLPSSQSVCTSSNNRSNSSSNMDSISGMMSSISSTLESLWYESDVDRIKKWLLEYQRELSFLEHHHNSPSTTTTSTTTSISTTKINKTNTAPALSKATVSHSMRIVYALLHHPKRAVQYAALNTITHAAHAVPSTAFDSLPVLIEKIHILTLQQHHYNAMQTTTKLRRSSPKTKLLLACLYALPRLGSTAAAVPFILRSMQPLLDTTPPSFSPATHAVALRMLCKLWIETGRGFVHLRAAVLAHSLSSIKKYALSEGEEERGERNDESMLLQKAWAATLLDICTHGGEKASEFIHSINECMTDTTSFEMQSVGLDCIAVLCEQDILDFFKAWQVVRRTFPTLPLHARVAAAWVRLLGAGHLDAEVYPEICRNIVDALWVSIRSNRPAHRDSVDDTIDAMAMVRCQGYLSLSLYDPGTLQKIDALSPLWEYSELLRYETNPICMDACKNLMSMILRYEYSTRRAPQSLSLSSREWSGKHSSRDHVDDDTTQVKIIGRRKPLYSLVMAGEKGRDQAQVALYHRLVSTIPKALLKGKESQVKSGHQSQSSLILQKIPEISPTAVLYLWAPSISPTSKNAAHQACIDYATVFSEICSSQHQLSTLSLLSTAHAGVHQDGDDCPVIDAFSPFLRRWVSACKEADGATTEEAVNVVWDSMRGRLEDVDARGAAVLAAAALCTAYAHPPSRRVVNEARAAISKHAKHALELHSIGSSSGSSSGSGIGIGGGSSGMAMHAAACIALGRIADVVRQVCGVAAATEDIDFLVTCIRTTLDEKNDKTNDTDTRLSTATASDTIKIQCCYALGMACKHASPSSMRTQSNVAVVNQAVSTLLSCIISWYRRRNDIPPAVHDIINILDSSSLPLEKMALPACMESSSIELVAAACHAVALSMPVLIANESYGSKIIAALRLLSLDILSYQSIHSMDSMSGVGALSSSLSSSSGWNALLCSANVLLSSTSLALYKLKSIHADIVYHDISLLLSFVDQTATNNKASKNGHFVGSIARVLGGFVPGALSQGLSLHQVEDNGTSFQNTDASVASNNNNNVKNITPESLLHVYSSIIKNASAMSGVAAAKSGVAIGISLLLQGQFLNPNPSFAINKKQALDILESLSFTENDPRVKTNACHILAVLCYSVRREGSKSLISSSASSFFEQQEETSKDKASSTSLLLSRGLGNLRDDGALRYLCETAILSAWPTIEEEEEEAKNREKTDFFATFSSFSSSSLHAKTLLQCLATAPRLPALDWTSILRRFMNNNNDTARNMGIEVQKACIECIAVHASISPSLAHHYHLYDIIYEDILSRHRFILFNNDVQDVVIKHVSKLIKALPEAEACDVLSMLCSLFNAQDDADLKKRASFALLMESLSEIAQSSDDEIAQHAQQLVLNTALPTLPEPTLSLPLRVPSFAGVETTCDEIERAWHAVLRCAMIHRTGEYGVLLKENGREMHAAWLNAALVANGAVSDLSLLQHSRNSILNGAFLAPHKYNTSITTGNTNTTTINMNTATEEEEAAILFIARAFAVPSNTISLQKKIQWMSDVVFAVEKSENKKGARALALCLVVGIACCSISSESSKSPDNGGGAMGVSIDSISLPISLMNSSNAFMAVPTSLQILVSEKKVGKDVVMALIRLMDDSLELKRRCCEALRMIYDDVFDVL